MKALKTTLLIPTLNEVDSMKIIMPRVQSNWVDEILVVDGGSDDGTVEYARQNGYHVVSPQVRGLVPQLDEAFKLAQGDIIVLFSPDGNSIPELIPKVIDKIHEGYDMVIVSRYADGAKSYDDDCLTAIGNFVFTRMVNLRFGTTYTDVLVIFRAFRKDILNTITIDPDEDIDLQLSIKCGKTKLKVAEIPGDEPKRVAGVRKMKIMKTGWELLRTLYKESFSKR
ncbi:MAG: glycosyltransferase family 2 protein [Desulfomonile tiedjei]|nr:glycosyltransferase family 2 protein [Desulfomonile tiedjei]